MGASTGPHHLASASSLAKAANTSSFGALNVLLRLKDGIVVFMSLFFNDYKDSGPSVIPIM
jgi:hypothetical protein